MFLVTELLHPRRTNLGMEEARLSYVVLHAHATPALLHPEYKQVYKKEQNQEYFS